MHSDKLSNPLDPSTKAHKELTSKRKKTDEDHELILHSEWLGSLYFDDSIGPYVPGINVESMLMEAAKAQKLGKKFKSAIMVVEDRIKLDYEGPRDRKQLFNDQRFVDIRSVKVQQARIHRCRPIFSSWSITFQLNFDQALVDLREIKKALEDAGQIVGLGDFRPRFGRFEVVT
jgi:hypothetical protein